MYVRGFRRRPTNVVLCLLTSVVFLANKRRKLVLSPGFVNHSCARADGSPFVVIRRALATRCRETSKKSAVALEAQDDAHFRKLGQKTSLGHLPN